MLIKIEGFTASDSANEPFSVRDMTLEEVDAVHDDEDEEIAFDWSYVRAELLKGERVVEIESDSLSADWWRFTRLD